MGGKGKYMVIKTHSDVLVRVVHHSYQHVKENYKRDDVVGAEHCGTNKLGELVVGPDIGHIEADQAKN